MIQTHGRETDILRVPTSMEIRVQIGMALIYGSKGIGYYKYHTKYPTIPERSAGCFVNVNSDPDDNIDAHDNTSIYYEAQTNNSKMHSIASELLNLTWQKAYYINSTGSKINIHGSGYDYISSVSNGDYIQVGNFTKNTDNYFMLLNRKCNINDTQTISVELNDSFFFNNTAIINVATGEYIYSNTNAFQVTLEPGDWDLFKIINCP